MYKFFTTIAIFIAVLIPKTLIALDAPQETAQLRIEDYIRIYTTLYQSDTDTVYSVMLCESEGKWIGGDMRDGKYNSFGHFAYFKETWNRYSQLYRATFGVDDQFDIYSIHDEAKLTSWVFSLEEVNKTEWTTYVAIKNGGTYRFYSKFHQAWFTVICPLKKAPN